MRTRILRNLLVLLVPVWLAACSSSNNSDVLQSALKPNGNQQTVYGVESARTAPASSQTEPGEIASSPSSGQLASAGQTEFTRSELNSNVFQAGQDASAYQRRNSSDGASFAAYKPDIQPLPPRESKTYLINGLASSVKAIGYGFTNLAKKIPNSELYNYASFIESSTVIRSRITKDMKAIYRRNPNIEFNMIGISFGANIVTLIAADLERVGIPVNYLVTMDGPAMVPIRDNVAIADNFTCSNLDCFRTKSRLARGNNVTRFESFKIATSHIPLANHTAVHSRIISQLRESRRAYRYSNTAR